MRRTDAVHAFEAPSRRLSATPPRVAPPRVAPPRVAPPRVAPPRVAPPRVAPPRVARLCAAPPCVASARSMGGLMGGLAGRARTKSRARNGRTRALASSRRLQNLRGTPEPARAIPPRPHASASRTLWRHGGVPTRLREESEFRVPSAGAHWFEARMDAFVRGSSEESTLTTQLVTLNLEPWLAQPNVLRGSSPAGGWARTEQVMAAWRTTYSDTPWQSGSKGCG